MPVNSDIGNLIEPISGRWIDDFKIGKLEAVKKVLFHITHTVFHPAFFIALADIARSNGKAVVGGEVQIFRIKHGRFAQGALEHGGFEVVDHDFVRNAPKEVKGMLVAGEEVFHGLGDGELDVQHATVAQDHHKETQLAVRLPDRDRAKRAPIHLGTLAGGARCAHRL